MTDHDRRQEMLDLEPRLLSCAQGLTRDDAEASALVQQTLRIGRERNYGLTEGASAQAWMFRVLRQSFHSVARDRDYRRSLRGPAPGFGSNRDEVLATPSDLVEPE